MEKKSLVIISGIIAVAIIAGSVFSAMYLLPKNPGSQPPSTIQTSSSLSNVAPYDCSLPANVSQYSCDTLPSGYQIKPKLPNAPPVYCLPQMTQSACALLQQTYGNGVCDPNETPVTAPLDCACPGVTQPDPYTGRCGSPATVCQAARNDWIAPILLRLLLPKWV